MTLQGVGEYSCVVEAVPVFLLTRGQDCIGGSLVATSDLNAGGALEDLGVEGVGVIAVATRVMKDDCCCRASTNVATVNCIEDIVIKSLLDQ